MPVCCIPLDIGAHAQVCTLHSFYDGWLKCYFCFTDENMAPGYRSLESLWGSSMEPMAPGAAWLWGSGGGVPPAPAAEQVRPPPGFSAPRPVRPYDPFQSLASIWTPAALDWRLDTGTPPPVPNPSTSPAPGGPSASATPPLTDDKFDNNGN